MQTQDKLQNLYEQMIEKEHKDIEEKNPDLIESMLKRIKVLEDKMILLTEGR